MIVTPRSAARTQRRFGAWAWFGAVAVHAGIFAILQFGGAPARSSMPLPPATEAVRVQAMDAEILRQRREAHQQALRRLEQARQREAQAKEEERQRRRALREALKRKAREAKQRTKREAERKRAEAAEREARKLREAKAAAVRAEAERQAKVLKEKLAQAERVASQRRAARLRQQRQEAERRSRQLGEWTLAIRTHIESRWRQPPTAASRPCEAVVEQDEGGKVLSVEVRKCAASQAWQDSLRNAVLKASPLPAVPHKKLFEPRLVITFHPRERN